MVPLTPWEKFEFQMPGTGTCYRAIPDDRDILDDIIEVLSTADSKSAEENSDS